MPRRRAAQNAASKISDIADKENDSSEKKTRTAKSSAGKSLKEPLIKKTSGQNEEIICSKAEQPEIQTDEKRINLTKESDKASKSDKTAKEKKRIPKKDQENPSAEGKISDDPRKNWSEHDATKVKRSQPKEKNAKDNTVSKGKTKPRQKQASTSTIENSDATMTVYQSKQVMEPRLHQNKRQNNRKTVPDDDMDSIPKPKTRQKKESTINPKETARVENNDGVHLEKIKTTKAKARATGRKKNMTGQEENENDKSLKVQSPNEGSVMKPDLGHNDETMDDLKVHMPKGEQMTTQDKPKRLGQTKKLKSSEQIEEEILVVRSQISQWWDKCYYGKEQRTLCRPFFDENLTSSNLTSLKKEETKLRKFYEKNRHIFDNISLQRDTKQNQGPSNTGADYEAEILAKDKELQDCRILHKEIFHQLESQLEEKEKQIYQLERNIQEMKSNQTVLQPQEKHQKMTTTPRTTEECLNSTYTKENDRDFEKKKNQSATTCTNEDFHEVNVLYEFCQKQKKTIRNLEREIELMRRERRKQANDFSEPGGPAE